jgi:hypothetical protein
MQSHLAHYGLAIGFTAYKPTGNLALRKIKPIEGIFQFLA